jgi:hypothetical protein
MGQLEERVDEGAMALPWVSTMTTPSRSSTTTREGATTFLLAEELQVLPDDSELGHAGARA